jgi:hypothetical protein
MNGLREGILSVKTPLSLSLSSRVKSYTVTAVKYQDQFLKPDLLPLISRICHSFLHQGFVVQAGHIGSNTGRGARS